MSESIHLRRCPGSGAVIPPSPLTPQAGVCPRCRRTVNRDEASGQAALHYLSPRRGR